VGGGDNDCAAIGAGAYALGTTSISLGTAGIILTQLESPPEQTIGDLDVLPHVISDRWYAMGMVPSAGMSLAWLKRRLVDEALETHSGEGLATDEWLTSMAPASSQSSSESDGLFFFPFLQGKGNPSKNAAARGVFWGLSGGHSNRHLVQAVMEGTGYCVGQCVDQISRVAQIDEVICCGGGSASSPWMQILANILNRPVWTQRDTEVGALGAAILAATGVGIFDTVHSACSEMTRRDIRYDPIKQDVEIYASKAEQFLALSDRFWGAGSPVRL
jgi:xylulokinase